METNLRLVLLLVGCLIIAGVLWDVWRRYRQDKKFRRQMDDLNQGNERGRSNKLSQLTVDHFEKTIYTQRLASHPAAEQSESSVSQADPDIPPMGRAQSEPVQRRVEPTLHLGEQPVQHPHLETPDLHQPVEMAVEHEPEPEPAPPPPPKPQTACMISVVARDPNGFAGSDLLNALETANLFYGRMNIFHRTTGPEGEGDIIFSACRVNEPGYFSYASMPQQHIPGVTLFFVAEEVDDPVATLSSMVGTAKQLSFNLNGDLRDHQHKPLTIQTIEKYKQLMARVAHQSADMVEMAE